jgi:hypothetical protein
MTTFTKQSAGNQMANQFDPQVYGPVIADFWDRSRLNALGVGTPEPSIERRLVKLLANDLFPSRKVVDAHMAAACLAGLWLFWDFLDKSHALSQSIDNATGSFWHAIMHRREGDFSNSKYWFHRVGSHPAYQPLLTAARDLITQSVESGELVNSRPQVESLIAKNAWDADAWVDLCRAAQSQSPELAPLCRAIQQREWELLFDHSYRYAVAHND